MIYLDNAATSLKKPQEVEEAVIRAIHTMGNPGRGAHEATLQAGRCVYQVREQLAELFHAEKGERIAFTSNATEALNTAILGLFHKVYPCGMLSGIVVSTTKVSEFLAAMSRIHAPKKLVIPLAVMLRYVPTIQEDWRFIKDAMRMRDVSPSPKGLLTHPAMTVECIYVPLMMAASKAADELSIASITRGIENPKPRTCLVQIHIGPADLLAGVCFAAYLAVGLYWKGVFG